MGGLEPYIGWIVGDSWTVPQDFSLLGWLTSVWGLAMLGAIALEVLYPRERRSFSRHNLLSAAYFVFGAKLAIIGSLGPVLERWWFMARLPSFRLDTRLPGLAYGLAGLLVISFGDYWCHRWLHRTRWGWHIHKIHHAPTKLNWATRYHAHFAMPILHVPVVTALACLMGAHLVAPFGALTVVADLFAHVNTRLTFGPLNYLFVTPDTHAYHHANDPRFYHSNYGNVLMIWDQLFGTFHYDPAYRPGQFGIHEAVPSGFVGQQIAPLAWIARDVRDSRVAQTLLGRAGSTGVPDSPAE